MGRVEIAKRLRQARNEAKHTQASAASALGLTSQAISNYERGINGVESDILRRLCDLYQVSVDWVLGGSSDDPIYTYPGLLPIETKKVPLLGTMACGEPVYREEDFESYVAIGNDVNANAAVRAEGDSMVGARILDGDIVFVRYQPSVENGEIAALWVDEGFTIKRFYQYDGVCVLHSENPNYKDMVFQESDCKNIKILGKAVAFQSDVK